MAEDNGFYEELVKFDDIIDKELSQAIAVACMNVEREMSPEEIVRGVLTKDIGNFLNKEITGFVTRLSDKIDKEEFAEDLTKRLAEQIDYIAHKNIKKSLNAFANRIKEHQKLIKALWLVTQNVKNNTSD
jgi:hypothetical protein